VVVGNTVIAATEGGALAAFALLTGSPLWSVGGLGKITASPAVADGIAVIGTTTGHVYGVRVSDGHRLWDWRAPGDQPAIWSSPAISETRMLIGVASPYGDSPLQPGRVAALDLKSGKELWTLCTLDACTPGAGVWSSVAVDEAGRGYVGVGNPTDGVTAFEVATGKVLWTTSLHPDSDRDLDVGATPIVANIGGREIVAVGSNAGVFVELEAVTGAVIWSRFVVLGSAVHGLIAAPAFDGRLLFVPTASSPTGITALNPATGAVIWQRLTDLPVYSAPAVGADVLVFGTGDVFGDEHAGSLLAVSTLDGSVVWRQDMGSSVFSAPAIAGDVVVVGDTQGELVAFRPA
jgi:outer membrane protein assembly factor BamB